MNPRVEPQVRDVSTTWEKLPMVSLGQGILINPTIFLKSPGEKKKHAKTLVYVLYVG